MRGHFVKTYCFSYGVFRFLAEFLRGDNRGSTGFALSPSQAMSIILIVIGILLVLYDKGIAFKKLHAKMQAYSEETEIYGISVRADVKATLRKMKALKDNGVITDEEYELAEEKLTQRITEKP